MEVRHPPEGCLLLSVFGGVSIMVWGGKHPPKGGVKKSLPSALLEGMTSFFSVWHSVAHMSGGEGLS